MEENHKKVWQAKITTTTILWRREKRSASDGAWDGVVKMWGTQVHDQSPVTGTESEQVNDLRRTGVQPTQMIGGD